MARVINFNAGPSTLPVSVLETAAEQLVDYQGEGLSIMEASHRSKMYDDVHQKAINLIKELYTIPDNYDVLLLQGGASTQFALIPMNLLLEGGKSQYVDTGAWANKAIKEVKIQGKNVEVAGSSANTSYDRIPTDMTVDSDADYFYIASNNTIYGTQYQELPDTCGVPLVIDASSDIFSKPIDWTNIGVLFAGAQKNAGPSGVTIVIIRKDLTERVADNVPTMFKYSTHAEKDSLFNTPPTFGIYMLSLVMKWLKDNGGLETVQQTNIEKAGYIYDTIDNSGGFYIGHAQKDSRSLMNITFNIVDKELEVKFVTEAQAAGMIGLKGHRSIGGIRASIYNAMPVEGCKKLAEFMKEFQLSNKK